MVRTRFFKTIIRGLMGKKTCADEMDLWFFCGGHRRTMGILSMPTYRILWYLLMVCNWMIFWHFSIFILMNSKVISYRLELNLLQLLNWLDQNFCYEIFVWFLALFVFFLLLSITLKSERLEKILWIHVISQVSGISWKFHEFDEIRIFIFLCTR